MILPLKGVRGLGVDPGSHAGSNLACVQHVVWDWNGTLFDDLHIVVEAVNSGIAALGAGPITLDDYRDHYTRPVKVFYDSLFGRILDDDEWHRLDHLFHQGYRDLLEHAVLRRDAAEALRAVRAESVGQSLLSMFPHDELIPLVERLGATEFFDRIDGLRGTAGDTKAAYLEAHLAELIGAIDPADVLVVGDTPDDALAAQHVGARCVLIDSGGHHRHHLTGLGVPVVTSLLEALDFG